MFDHEGEGSRVPWLRVIGLAAVKVALSMAFAGSITYAGTHRSGVLWLDSSREGAEWTRPDVGSGSSVSPEPV